MPESQKRRLNTEHPDCAEYTAQFDAIWDAYFALEGKEKAKYPDWSGKDYPAYVALRPIHRKCCEETRRLQKKYEYLFIAAEDK